MQSTCGEAAWGPPLAEHAAHFVWQRHAKLPQACARIGNAAGAAWRGWGSARRLGRSQVGRVRQLAC
ncbi:hypothetical protein Xcom_03265 [Xanthomonas axonopodis pv. commiphoreae]|nr:hypothetical protein Xcom_03265 [Xanthomonas axonopodis pv. commiphoreae]